MNEVIAPIAEGYFWFNVICLAIGTIAIRGSIIAISKRVKITERMKELFSFIPAAILPAILTPAVWFHQGQGVLLQGKERLVIAIFAAGVAFATRSTLATIAFGLVTLYFARAL